MLAFTQLLHRWLERAADPAEGRALNLLPLRKLVRRTHRAGFALTELRHNRSPRLGVAPAPEGEPPLVVSLTSIPERSGFAHLAVASLLRQTLRPARVVLWVSEGYPITRALLRLERRGLEIRHTEDIGAYRKLLPSLKRFPDALVVTFDDDFIYSKGILAALHRSWSADREAVHTIQALRMARSADGGLAPYEHWGREIEDGADGTDLMPYGGYGTLYPPGVFGDGERLEVFNSAAFGELAPGADDIWFKAMHLREGARVRVAPGRLRGRDISVDIQNSGPKLWRSNVRARGYDPQIKAVFERYDLLGSL